MVYLLYVLRLQTHAWPDAVNLFLQDGSSLHFTFDKVHGLPTGAGNTQADIFGDVQDIVLSTLECVNGCVMAYGQTGMSYGISGHLEVCCP